MLFRSKNGDWTPAHGWVLREGVMHVMSDSLSNVAVRFDSLRDAALTEPPSGLMANPKAPAEMGFRDLGRFIAAMERSGTDVRKLRVERMLKVAIPVTCVIIMLIGAPLEPFARIGVEILRMRRQLRHQQDWRAVMVRRHGDERGERVSAVALDRRQRPGSGGPQKALAFTHGVVASRQLPQHGAAAKLPALLRFSHGRLRPVIFRTDSYIMRQ